MGEGPSRGPRSACHPPCSHGSEPHAGVRRPGKLAVGSARKSRQRPGPAPGPGQRGCCSPAPTLCTASLPLSAPAVFRSKDFVTQACWLAAFTSILGSHEGCPVTLQGQCVLPPSLAAAQPRAAPWGRPCHHLEPWNPVLLRQRPDPPPRGPEDGTLMVPGPERSGLQSGVDPSCHFPL